MNDASCHNFEGTEFTDMSSVFTWLLKEDIVSDAEYTFIASTTRLVDRQAAVYKLLVSKNELTKALKVLEIFRNLACRVQVENLTVDECSRRRSGNMTEESNDPIRYDPLLLNNDVVQHIFDFIPVGDLKNCCLVSRHWNSNLQTNLRKRSVVIFDSQSERKPSAFLDTFNNSRNPPFSAFKFNDNGGGWLISELNLFFVYWGKYIKELNFNNVDFLDIVEHVKFSYYHFDISRWISLAPNLQTLNLHCCQGTKLEVRLVKLETISNLWLSRCGIVLEHQVAGESKTFTKHSTGLPQKLPNTRSRLLKTVSNNTRLVPRSISLFDVNFKEDGKVLKTVNLNKFFDFNKCLEMKVYDLKHNKLALNMDGQVFKAWCVHLARNELTNWGNAKGYVFSLHLNEHDFLERNKLFIQQLFITSAAINLSVLPDTIEKLDLAGSLTISKSRAVILPSLNYLCFDVFENNLECIDYFKQCSKLVEIEIVDSGYGSLETLNLNWLPMSLKKLKINCRFGIGTLFGNCNFKIETLILENYLPELMSLVPNVVTDFVSKIKPKVLILTWECTVDDDDSEMGSQSTNSDEDKLLTTNIIEFLLENQQMEKVIVGTVDDRDLHRDSPFETSIFSLFVDKKANHYQFVLRHGRPIGNALTREKFETLKTLSELDKRFYSCAEHK